MRFSFSFFSACFCKKMMKINFWINFSLKVHNQTIITGRVEFFALFHFIKIRDWVENFCMIILLWIEVLNDFKKWDNNERGWDLQYPVEEALKRKFNSYLITSTVITYINHKWKKNERPVEVKIKASKKFSIESYVKVSIALIMKCKLYVAIVNDFLIHIEIRNS